MPQHFLLPEKPRPPQPISPALVCSLRASFSLLSDSESCSRSRVSTSATFSCSAGVEVHVGCQASLGSWFPPPPPPRVCPRPLLHTLPVDLLLLGQLLPETGSLRRALLLALASRLQLQPQTGQGLLGALQLLFQLLGHFAQLLPLRLPWEDVVPAQASPYPRPQLFPLPLHPPDSDFGPGSSSVT